MPGAWTARPGAFECIVTKLLAAPGHVFIESIHITCVFLKTPFEDRWLHVIYSECSVTIGETVLCAAALFLLSPSYVHFQN